jgi:hypothetical protein
VCVGPPTPSLGASSPPVGGVRRTASYSLALVALGIVSRLPQLRSPNLLADGDECILGLMAKHVAQGREFPLFFYGQHYAFSPVETVAGALSFVVAGVGAVPLKVAGLALWILGIVFMFLALSKVLQTRRSFWISAILVLNPAWAVWSLRDGGGYLTSFAASPALVWLLLRDREHETIGRWLVAGALTALIYLAQPLWLPGLVPLVAAILLSRFRFSWAIGYGSVTAAAIVLVKIATATTSEAWGGPTMGNPDLLGSLPRVANQIYVALTGSHYLYWAIDPPGPATRIVAVVWCAALPVAALVQIYRLVTRRYCTLSHLLFLSVLSTLAAEWILLSARDARYLLPLSSLLVALAGVDLLDLSERRLFPRSAVVVTTTILVVLGSLSLREFREFNFLWANPAQRWTEAKRLQQVLNYLEVKDVHHVFSMNGMLDSQLVFYSNEKVLSRWSDPVGRYPPYVKEVNRSLADGEPVAVVGYTNQSGAPGCWDVPICTGGIERLVANPETIFTVDNKYFVYVGADRSLLTRLGFRFWD